jgi:hypothetical protein
MDPDPDPDLQQLLRSDSPADRTALYLRMLYSRGCASAVRELSAGDRASSDPRVLAFVRTVDFERLGLEQGARLRNLARGLGESFPCSWPVIELELRRELVARFVEDPSFWHFPGRSLAEGFALVAWRLLHERQRGFLADLLRLEGVLSGILAAPDVPASPWLTLPGVAHEQIATATGYAERYLSQWQLLDDAGELPGAERVAELMQRPPRPHRITLTLEPDGIEISCTRLAL